MMRSIFAAAYDAPLLIMPMMLLMLMRYAFRHAALCCHASCFYAIYAFHTLIFSLSPLIMPLRLLITLRYATLTRRCFDADLLRY